MGRGDVKPTTETLVFPTSAEGVIKVVNADELESCTRDGWERMEADLAKVREALGTERWNAIVGPRS